MRFLRSMEYMVHLSLVKVVLVLSIVTSRYAGRLSYVCH
jgi:hypothetical protein